jgi:hypothetical protein
MARPLKASEVESCRAEELAHRRGLTSELDEMWGFVGKKAASRWLWLAALAYPSALISQG